jgi:hypothetical protein
VTLLVCIDNEELQAYTKNKTPELMLKQMTKLKAKELNSLGLYKNS